jgi:Activator of Hsp90 ATPase homolog 1-like protein
MTTKIQTDYQATIVVPVGAHQAFEDISDVSSWWTKNFKGSANQLGDTFSVHFGETWSSFEIVELVPDQKIVWYVKDCNLHWLKDKKEWKGTRVLWEIVPINGATEIHMTHLGLKPGIECFDDCTIGWNHYVRESLFKLLKEGEGVPDHPNHSARDRQ